MHKQLSALVVAGSFALMTGCALIPGMAGTGVATGTMNFGLAGAGYAVQALPLAASDLGTLAVSDLSYAKVNFQPTKIELHYAGDVAATDPVPADVKGETSDQSGVNTSDAGDAEPTANDGKWITLPVENPAAVDLVALGAQGVSFGEEALKAGKYDQIRLSGGGDYEATDASGSAKAGAYTLPSGRLYIKHGFEIKAGYKTDLKFAFEANKSMVAAGSKIILKPNAVKVFATYTKEEPAATPSATPAS